VDVVVAHGDAHRVGRDDHPLDDDVRVELQDVAVLAGARLALVGVAHQVLLARELARHERPLQAGGEAGAAAAAQRRFLDGGDDLVLRQAVLQDLAQGLVAVARLVVLQAPVGAVQVLVDLRVDVAAVEAGLHAGGLELRQHLLGVHGVSPLQSIDQLVELVVAHEAAHGAVVDQHHRRVGAGAQALALLQREQAVGRGLAHATPSLCSRWCSALAPSRSWHGRLVHTFSLYLPTGAGCTCCRRW
jgi:hypothetical protein